MNHIDFTRPYGKLYKSGYFHSLNREIEIYNSGNLKAGANNTERTYKIDKKVQALFVSRVITMQENARNGLKTFILTYDSNSVDDTQVRNNRFLSNLRKNYKLNSYAWTLELTKKGQYHYHYLVDMPYTKIDDINNAWSSARGYYSNNAVRAFKSVYKVKTAAIYAAKYMSKAKKAGKEEYKVIGFPIRLYATSNNLVGNETIPVPSYELFQVLDNNCDISITNEYTVSGYASSELTQFVRSEITKTRKIYTNEHRINTDEQNFHI
jgi:hypothetical protein